MKSIDFGAMVRNIAFSTKYEKQLKNKDELDKVVKHALSKVFDSNFEKDIFGAARQGLNTASIYKTIYYKDIKLSPKVYTSKNGIEYLSKIMNVAFKNELKEYGLTGGLSLSDLPEYNAMAVSVVIRLID